MRKRHRALCNIIHFPKIRNLISSNNIVFNDQINLRDYRR